jgi:hypothetical protein
MSDLTSTSDASTHPDLEPVSERERELVGLIKVDYDAALRAISGFVSTGGQLRGIGVAAWGVVIGLAVRDESALLAGLAMTLVVIFAYADAYHAALYRRALRRAITLEELLDTYLDRLGIDYDDEDAVQRALAKLETHRFGMYHTLRPLRIRDLVLARPRVVFWLVYPGLVFAALAATIVYAS